MSAANGSIVESLAAIGVLTFVVGVVATIVGMVMFAVDLAYFASISGGSFDETDRVGVALRARIVMSPADVAMAEDEEGSVATGIGRVAVGGRCAADDVGSLLSSCVEWVAAEWFTSWADVPAFVGG